MPYLILFGYVVMIGLCWWLSSLANARAADKITLTQLDNTVTRLTGCCDSLRTASHQNFTAINQLVSRCDAIAATSQQEYLVLDQLREEVRAIKKYCDDSGIGLIEHRLAVVNSKETIESHQALVAGKLRRIDTRLDGMQRRLDNRDTVFSAYVLQQSYTTQAKRSFMLELDRMCGTLAGMKQAELVRSADLASTVGLDPVG